MEEVDVPFPDGISIQAIQEDDKPGGESLVLGNHIKGSVVDNSWNPLAGSATESGYTNGALIQHVLIPQRALSSLMKLKKSYLTETITACDSLHVKVKL